MQNHTILNYTYSIMKYLINNKTLAFEISRF